MLLIKAKKIVKIGNSHYLNIPIVLIDSKVIDKDKLYDYDISEAE